MYIHIYLSIHPSIHPSIYLSSHPIPSHPILSYPIYRSNWFYPMLKTRCLLVEDPPLLEWKHHSWQWDRLLGTCKASIGCSWHEPTRKHRSHLWTEEKKTDTEHWCSCTPQCVYLYVSYTCDCSTCFGNSLTMASSSTDHSIAWPMPFPLTSNSKSTSKRKLANASHMG